MAIRLFIPGFTLVELLIALTILGEIVAFTIPKIVMSQQRRQFDAAAKEDVGVISTAFQNYKLQSSFDINSFQFSDLEKYINYAAIESSSSMDTLEGYGGYAACGSTYRCLKMHNGSTIYWQIQPASFNSGWAIFFVDPDSVILNGGSTTGPSKSAGFNVYPSGRIETLDVNTPTWFKW